MLYGFSATVEMKSMTFLQAHRTGILKALLFIWGIYDCIVNGQCFPVSRSL